MVRFIDEIGKEIITAEYRNIEMLSKELNKYNYVQKEKIKQNYCFRKFV